MEFRKLKNISISNLILIILNKKNADSLRKHAEIELRNRVKNVGWEFDDILHFDDKVIQNRGLDKKNYLISPNIDMQQLMEIFFAYNWKTNCETNNLLFSEKHLCNSYDFGDSFFTKICKKEINNIDIRLQSLNDKPQKETLLLVKEALEERNESLKQFKIKQIEDDPTKLLCHNESIEQLFRNHNFACEFLKNYSDEEIYKIINSRFGLLKTEILNYLSDTLFDNDLMQYLYGLRFIRKDSSKLDYQKRQVIRQAKNNFEVNYETNQIKKALLLKQNTNI